MAEIPVAPDPVEPITTEDTIPASVEVRSRRESLEDWHGRRWSCHEDEVSGETTPNSGETPQQGLAVKRTSNAKLRNGPPHTTAKKQTARTTAKVYCLQGRSTLGYSLLPTLKSVSNGTKKKPHFLRLPPPVSSIGPHPTPNRALLFQPELNVHPFRMCPIYAPPVLV
eukprot:5675308-Pyramimonas_sp.AAC.2